MRIAIVFSSPTPDTKEFRNIWRSCPEKRELDSDKLVIEGGDWKVFAFDGQSNRFYDGKWNLEALRNEITGIMEEYTTSALGILLHGTKKELTLLIEQLQVPNAQEIYHKWYTSSKGTFYKKYIKPFSNDGSDGVFKNLWDKLDKKETEESVKETLIGVVKHQMRTNFVLSLDTVKSFSKEPNKEKFQKIHRLLIKTGALDRAEELVSDLRTEYEKISPKKNHEIETLAISLNRVRFLLDSGFDGNKWEPNRLEEFKDLIEYLSDKK